MHESNAVVRIDHPYSAGTWAGGATRGIWAEPAAAIGSPAAARAWAGTATIERTAPYSHFAGHNRLQILLAGAELRLRFREPNEELALVRGAQYQFSGERPVEATPIGGPVLAFNLIYHSEILATATVATIAQRSSLWPLDNVAELGVQRERMPIRLIYVVAGAIEVNGPGTTAALKADDTLVAAFHLHQAAAPMLELKAVEADAAEVILATFWLPADGASAAG